VSYPSGAYLVASIVEDSHLPLTVRVSAAKSCSLQAPLLRIIHDPNTPAKLKAVATIRYSQLASIRLSIREAKRARRTSRS
jgi:hypothetical protein